MFRRLFALLEPFGSKVVNNHVVEFFGQLVDAAKDVHLVVEGHCGCARARHRLEVIILISQFGPLFRGGIIGPQIAKFIVVVVLPAKHEELAVVESRRVAGTNWGTPRQVILAQNVPSYAHARRTELKQLICARTIHEATKHEETSIIKIAHGVVISGEDFRGGSLSHSNSAPRIGHRVEQEDVCVVVFAFETAVEEHFFLGQDRHSVVRNFTRTSSRRVNALPLHVVVVVLEEGTDSGETYAPHGGNGSLFKVAATVNVHVFIIFLLQNEGGVV